MIEWIVTSCALIVVIIALRKLLKGRISLRLQYALWALVLIRLLVPLSFGSSRMSVMNGVNKALPEREFSENIGIFTAAKPAAAPKSLKTSEPQEAKTGASSAGNLSTDGGSLYTITQDDGTILIQPAGAPVVSIEEPMRPLLTASPERNAVRASGSTAVSAPSEQTKESSENGGRNLSLKTVLNAVWLSGAIITDAVFLFSNISFFLRLKKSRRRLENADSKLPVYVSGAVETPCLFGLFRPSIYLTDRSANDEAQLHHILLHEQTHYRHGDHVFSMLRALCLALHWYNPLVWLAAILSRRDQELACDESVIKRIGESRRADYARTLIELTCEKRSLPFLSATTMTGSASSIKERITLIVKKPKTSAAVLVAALAAVAILIGCTFTGAKRIESAAPKTDEASNEAPKNSIAAANANDEWFLNDAARLAKQIEKSYPFELDADKASLELRSDSSFYLLDSMSAMSVFPIAVSYPLGSNGLKLYINYTLKENDIYSSATFDDISFGFQEDPFFFSSGEIHDDLPENSDYIFAIDRNGVLCAFDVDEKLAARNMSAEELGMEYAEEYAKCYVNLDASDALHCTDAKAISCVLESRSVLKTQNRFNYSADIALKPDDIIEFIHARHIADVGLYDPEKDPETKGYLRLSISLRLANDASEPINLSHGSSWGMQPTGFESDITDFLITYMTPNPDFDLQYVFPDATECTLANLASVDLKTIERVCGQEGLAQLSNIVTSGCIGALRAYPPDTLDLATFPSGSYTGMSISCNKSDYSWHDATPYDQEYRNIYIIRAVLDMDEKYVPLFLDALKMQRDFDPTTFKSCLESNFSAEERSRITELIGEEAFTPVGYELYDYMLLRTFFSLRQPSGTRNGDYLFASFNDHDPAMWISDDERGISFDESGHITSIKLAGKYGNIAPLAGEFNLANLSELKSVSVSTATLERLSIYGCPKLENIDIPVTIAKDADIHLDSNSIRTLNLNSSGSVGIGLGTSNGDWKNGLSEYGALSLIVSPSGTVSVKGTVDDSANFNVELEALEGENHFVGWIYDLHRFYSQDKKFSVSIKRNIDPYTDESFFGYSAYFLPKGSYEGDDVNLDTALDAAFNAADELGKIYNISFNRNTAIARLDDRTQQLSIEFHNGIGQYYVNCNVYPGSSVPWEADISDCRLSTSDFSLGDIYEPTEIDDELLIGPFPILKRETELAPTSEELEKAVLAYGDKLIELFTSAGGSYEAICDDAKLLACERYERLDNDGEYGCYVDLLLHPVDLARFLNNITRAEIYAESDHPEYRGYFRLRGYALLDDDGSDFVSAAKFENNPRALAYYIEGDASNVQIEEMSSERYSDDELDMAVQTIIENFRYEDDCTLEKLAYTGDAQSELEAQKYSDSADSADMLLFVSTVKVGDFGPDDSLEPNATYDNWYWLLSRNKGGAFTVLDSGPWN